MVRRVPGSSSIARFTAGLAATVLCGCGSGTPGTVGDTPQLPPADPYGNGSRISELVGEAVWLNPDDIDSTSCGGIPQDRKVDIDGSTLTWVDTYDETGDGALGNLYMQDSFTSPVPYSGITVFQPGFSPPDLRVVPGDVVDLNGLLVEFPGPAGSEFSYCRTLPEVTGAMELRFDGGGVTPLEITPEDLAGYEKARRFFGMLVTLKNVTLTQNPYEAGSGRYSVRFDVGGGVLEQDLPTITNEHFDLKNEGPILRQGTVLTELTGIVTFFFGTHVAPRRAADIVIAP